MNRNLKLDERVNILVLHRQGYNISEISRQLNCTRNTARRWIQRDENEGSLVDRPRPHPPRKNKPQDGAPNATEAQTFSASKKKKKNSSSTNPPSHTNKSSKKQPAAKTPVKQSEKVDKLIEIEEDTINYIQYKIMKEQGQKITLRIKEGVVPHIFNYQKTHLPLPLHHSAIKKDILPLSSVTQAAQPGNTNKKSRTKTNIKSTRTSARSNKQIDIPTSEAQSETDDHLTKSSPTQASQAGNTNKNSLTKTINKSPCPSADSNKETDVPTSEVQSEIDDHLPKVTGETQNAEDGNTRNSTEVIGNKRKKKQMDDVKLPEAEVLIASVYKFLQAEYEFLVYYIGDICDLSPLTNVLKRTADACGVCKFTVRHIVDKTRAQTDRGEVGPAKRAKLRRQVLQINSLAQEESSCNESEKEELEVNKEIDDDSSIKLEESSSDSEDEIYDEDKYMDEYSESDESEVEAPNMYIGDDEHDITDPLKTEHEEVKTEATDVVNTPTSDPLNTSPVEMKTESTDELDSLPGSDVIPMTSLTPVKTESDDNSSCSIVASTSDPVCDTTSCDVKCEPPGLG